MSYREQIINKENYPSARPQTGEKNPARGNLLERKPGEESRRGIQKRNLGAESPIGIQRGIQKRNLEEEYRSGVPDRNPAREQSRRGIRKRNAGAEAQIGIQRGI